MLRRAAVVLLLAALLGPLCAPAAGQDGGTPSLYIRDWLAAGNWNDLASGERLVRLGSLPFEGRMIMGRLWTTVSARDDGYVDLNVLGPVAPEVALAHVYVRSDKAAPYRLLVGCDDRAAVLVNGKAYPLKKTSGAWKADEETFDVSLREGWNQLLVRVESDFAAFGFSARLTLPDGRPAALETSVTVPEAWHDKPQLKAPLSREDITELLELLAARINSVTYQAARVLRTWQGEGEALDASYGSARRQATDYVEALRDLLRALPAPEDEEAEAARRAASAAAGERLLAASLAGPYQLSERTRRFLELSHRGEGLWGMVRFAATTVHQAGRQAAEVDRALVEARALLAAVQSEYLRPYALREKTAAVRTAEWTLRLASRQDGTPLAGADVTVEQTGHEFAFGGNLFAWGRFDQADDETTYRRQFARLFNVAVVPVYWSLIEPQEGQVDYQRDARGWPGPEPMVQWCREQGLRVAATPLVSDDVRPAWLAEKPAEEIAALAEARVREAVSRFRGRVAVWDIAAESWPTVPVGKASLEVSRLLTWAHEADPEATLLVSSRAPHALLLAAQKERGESFGLGGVSLSADHGRGAWPAAELETQLDRVARGGAALYLGHVAIPGGRSDEAEQARQVEAFYRTAFAHAAVRGITWWDLSDRYARGGVPAGLLRADLSAKPAYEALDRLINVEWRSRSESMCDALGKVTFRGYFGRYRVRAVLPNKETATWTVELRSDGPRDVDLLYPPAGTGE